ncbi:hypothetical protein BGX38DRAFT_164353 [Terfezia claveryi]|nr:hypothetical protein BGX38DRAFT_164353 [Terfezia claveryi]
MRLNRLNTLLSVFCTSLSALSIFQAGAHPRYVLPTLDEMWASLVARRGHFQEKKTKEYGQSVIISRGQADLVRAGYRYGLIFIRGAISARCLHKPQKTSVGEIRSEQPDSLHIQLLTFVLGRLKG